LEGKEQLVRENAMPTKVTVSLDSELLARAKARARERGVSVSDLVQQGLEAALDAEPLPPLKPEDLPPITRSLWGALKGAKIDESDYLDYLEKKYR
jgi:hypothetical protein